VPRGQAQEHQSASGVSFGDFLALAVRPVGAIVGIPRLVFSAGYPIPDDHIAPASSES